MTKMSNRAVIVIISVVFSVLTIFGLVQIMREGTCPSCVVYNAMGFAIIMVWSCLFICYFIWATYYYNINYGVPDEVWHKVEEAKNNRSAGKFYNPEDLDDEPLYNPYSDQTFGLPSGTVRGMIAFTLLFGALALLLVSFGMKGELEPGTFFRDQFEFFKTAFLMMVAFYFGSKSLSALKGEKSLAPTQTVASQKIVSSDGGGSDGIQKSTGMAMAIPKQTVVVIDSNNLLGTHTDIPGEIPPITAIDPMAATPKR